MAESLLMAQRIPPQDPEEIKAINFLHKKRNNIDLCNMDIDN